MPTARSHFSFEQFEKVFQKMAHKVALDAVKTLKHGRTRIIIRENGTYSEVSTGQHQFRFYFSHASYEKKGGNYEKQFAFDVEQKIYLTSNHCTKISFWAPEGKNEERQQDIKKFIDKIMAEASIKPEPRFRLANFTGGQRHLDLINKASA